MLFVKDTKYRIQHLKKRKTQKGGISPLFLDHSADRRFCTLAIDIRRLVVSMCWNHHIKKRLLCALWDAFAFPFQSYFGDTQSLSLLLTPSFAASFLPLVFFPHGVMQTRKGNNQYLLKEGSIPPPLMNAVYGCARAARVRDYKGCLYNFSQLIFLPGHSAPEPEIIYKVEYESNYTSWWNTVKSCTTT